MSTSQWQPIFTIPAGVDVFAYREDSKTVSVWNADAESMQYIRERNKHLAYTYWMAIPVDWGKFPAKPNKDLRNE